jgi:hypothetical protein
MGRREVFLFPRSLNLSPAAMSGVLTKEKDEENEKDYF